MKYMGSKRRIAKYILPIILKDRKPNQWYVEPFVGGANMIDKVDGNRIGADANKYCIEALKIIRDDVLRLPEDESWFNENDYKRIKTDEQDIGLKGYAGFALSYGGKWFGGWCRGKTNNGKKRDYVNEAYKNAERQSKFLQGVKLINCSYDELYLNNDNSIIYCDPPYANTTKYKDDFDHIKFWQWCREMSDRGHKVFISEYSAPDDFICLWQKEINSSLTKDTGSKKGVEKLFTYCI